MDKYFFLTGSLYFGIITLWMYIKLPKYRKAMTILGLAIFWTGPVAEYFWFTKDWWHPQTITNTIIGPEDFIFSFTNVVIPIFIYKLVFKKDVDGELEMTDKNLIKNGIKKIIICFFIPFIIAGILFQLFHISSVICVAVGLFLAGFIILINRKDLLSEVLWSSFLMAIITMPAYWLLEFIFPKSIEKIWDFSKLTGITFLTIPIEDILFYSLLGFALGGVYEYIFGFKLIKNQKRAK